MESDAKIQFGEGFPTLLDYDKVKWSIGMTKTVEFFPNKIFTVKMVSSLDPNLEKYLNELDEDSKTSLNDQKLSKYEGKIAIDLEWEVEINLFQFCSPKGRVLLIRHPDGLGNRALFNFLISHKFYGKGTDSDVKQLHRKFSYLIKNDNINAKSKVIQKNNANTKSKKKSKKKKDTNADNENNEDTCDNNENTDQKIDHDNSSKNENEDNIKAKNKDENNNNENKITEINNENVNNAQIIVPTKFNINFNNLIEDIAKTRLTPYGYSENFVKMTKEFAGDPCADFKDQEMTMSNWAADELTVRQVLYGAFDVTAIYMCYPNFKPPIYNYQAKESKNALKKKDKKIKGQKKIVNRAKIIVLRNPVQKIYPFIIYGYSGPINPVDLRFIFQDSNHLNGVDGYEDDLDFVSTFTFNNTLYALAAFTKNISEKDIMNRLRGYADSAKLLSTLNNETINYDIDKIDPSDCTDRDFLYVTNIPNALFDKIHFSRFLYSFGTNFDFKIFDSNDPVDDFEEFYPLKSNKGYIQIEPRDASSSYRMKLFIPFLFSMKVDVFPNFLPIIRVDNILNEWSNEELKKIYPNSTKIDFLRWPNKQSKKTCFVEFKTVEEADNAIQRTNYLSCHSKSSSLSNVELYVARYTSEAHLKFLKLFEISVHHCKKHGLNSSKSLRDYFQKYGKIYQAYYNETFEIGHVQFYVRKDALKAVEEENNKSKNSVENQVKSDSENSNLDFNQPLFCETVPEDRIFVIRDVSFDVDDKEIYDLCSPYGDIQDIQTRDLTSYMRYSIKEITYSNSDSAYQARLSLFSYTIKGNTVRAAVLNGGNVESASWKNNQKKQWVIFRNIIHNKTKPKMALKSENKEKKDNNETTDNNSSKENSAKDDTNSNDKINENSKNDIIESNENTNKNSNENTSNTVNVTDNDNNTKNSANEDVDSEIVHDFDSVLPSISINDLYFECLKYGDIVRYEVHIGNGSDVCVMYSTFEYADEINKFISDDRVLSHFTLEMPNNEEFVSILNPKELGLVFITSKEKEKIKNEMEQLKKVVGDEEESTLVILFKSLHARDDAVDIYNASDANTKVQLPKKPNDPLDSVSVLTKEKIDEFLLEFAGMYTVYINDEEDRAIIFAQSKAIVKKIFKNFWQEGRFNPIRIKFKDIENPPSIDIGSSINLNNNNDNSNNNSNKSLLENLSLILNENKELNDDVCDSSSVINIEGFTGSEKIIVVDPIPDEMNEDIIEKICAESKGKFEIRITKSAKIEGMRRALLFGKNHATRNRLLREMSGAFKGHPIRSVAMYANEIPHGL